MRKLGYLRVSTQEQSPDRQIDGLEALCDALYIERVSAVSPKRPVFDEVVAALQAGDVLVVWDLDRAFRSVVDAILVVEKLRTRGISMQIVNLQVDTNTPAGMLVYTVLSAFAEFERRMLSQRTKEGLAAARKRGKRLGRPSKLTSTQLKVARRKLKAGTATISDLARHFGVASWSLTRAIRREEGKHSMVEIHHNCGEIP
jgi:DNA invertase Pin-like site-specific DNA recombinase